MLVDALGELRYTKTKVALHEKAFKILERQASLMLAKAKRDAGAKHSSPTQVAYQLSP